MKVIFLDIDGVLNTVASVGFRYCYGVCLEEKMESLEQDQQDPRRALATGFCPSALYSLRHIVEQTGAKIVVSSTWRHGETVETMRNWFYCPVIREAIIDKTPYIAPVYDGISVYVARGQEIDYWIKKYERDHKEEITSFVILDDDGDMFPLDEHLFQTNPYDGLRFSQSQTIIDKLNGGSNDIN